MQYESPICTIEHFKSAQDYDIEIQVFAENIRINYTTHPYFSNYQQFTKLDVPTFDTIFNRTIIPVQKFYEKYSNNFQIYENRNYLNYMNYISYYRSFNDKQEKSIQDRPIKIHKYSLENSYVFMNIVYTQENNTNNWHYIACAYDTAKNQHDIYNNAEFLTLAIQTDILPFLNQVVTKLSDPAWYEKYCQLRSWKNAW